MYICVLPSLAEDGALLGKIEKVRILRNDRREGNNSISVTKNMRIKTIGRVTIFVNNGSKCLLLQEQYVPSSVAKEM